MSSEVLNLESLRELGATRPGPCVSIYLENPGAGDTYQAPVRLSQLLARAESELEATPTEGVDAGELLAPVRVLLEEAWPWKGSEVSMLALFAAPDFFRQVAGRFTGTEEAVVGSRFRLRPLFSLLAVPERYYVLALSLNQVRLVEATPRAARRLPLGEMEQGFVEAMGYDEFYSELQAHSAGARGGGGTRRAAILHGHGDKDEEKLEEDLRHWFRRIADAVAGLGLDRRALRVLATTREHAPLYLAASRDPLLLPAPVAGNPDRLSDAELAARALSRVEEALARQRQEELASWREALGRERATGDLAAVLRLARQGRVQAVYLPADAELWGSYDADGDRLELHAERRPGDEDLLERAALETLERGGEVSEIGDSAELGGAPLAALLRG